MSSHHHQSDRAAAFSGLIFGVVAMFAMVFAIVYLTNRHYESEKGAKSATSATK
jgi:hypothetical protein